MQHMQDIPIRKLSLKESSHNDMQTTGDFNRRCFIMSLTRRKGLERNTLNKKRADFVGNQEENGRDLL